MWRKHWVVSMVVGMALAGILWSSSWTGQAEADVAVIASPQQTPAAITYSADVWLDMNERIVTGVLTARFVPQDDKAFFICIQMLLPNRQTLARRTGSRCLASSESQAASRLQPSRWMDGRPAFATKERRTRCCACRSRRKSRPPRLSWSLASACRFLTTTDGSPTTTMRCGWGTGCRSWRSRIAAAGGSTRTRRLAILFTVKWRIIICAFICRKDISSLRRGWRVQPSSRRQGRSGKVYMNWMHGTFVILPWSSWTARTRRCPEKSGRLSFGHGRSRATIRRL